MFQLVHSDEKKKHLTVESVMPVFPDVSLWSNTYTTVAFDKDPAVDDSVKGSEVRSNESKRNETRRNKRMSGGDHTNI